MTLIIMLLFDEGKNCLIMGDGYSELAEQKSKENKKIYHTFDGSIIVGAGSSYWIRSIVRAYNDLGFFYPNEKSFYYDRSEAWFILSPDIRLWQEYRRFLEFNSLTDELLNTQTKLDDFDTDLGICFFDGKKIRLTEIDRSLIYMDVTDQKYASIGNAWQTVNLLIKEEPWDIYSTKEEATRRANEIMDFCEEHCTGVGGKRQTTILFPNPAINKYLELKKEMNSKVHKFRRDEEVFEEMERIIKEASERKGKFSDISF